MTDLQLPSDWTFFEDGAGGGQWVQRGRASLPDLAGPVTPPPATNFNPALVFELEPLRPALKLSIKKVVLHLFVTGQLGGDVGANNDHWWDDRLPGGSVRESDGDWLVRDKPYDPWEATRPRANESGVSFQVLDKQWELQQYIDAAIDGGWADLLNVNDGTGDNRSGQVKDYMRAAYRAAPDLSFPVAPMIDGNTSIGQIPNLDMALQRLAEMYALPGCWKLPDGRMLNPVYMAEGSAASGHDATAAQVVTHYTSLSNRLASERGIEGAFWWCPQRGAASPSGDPRPGWAGTKAPDPTASPPYAGQGYGSALVGVPRTIGLSRWGTRDPVATLNTNSQNAGAAAYAHSTFPGLLWCTPVSVGDSRPNQNKYWEQEGFGQLLASWQVAIDFGADWVQIPTSSDYPEHAHVGPSRNHGWVWLDLMSYYLTRFKLGAWQPVQRDGLYLAHRVHPSAGYANQAKTSTGGAIPTQVLQPSTAAADIVDVLAFLTDTTATEIRITSGGIRSDALIPDASTKAYGGPGVYRFSVPLRVGAPPSVELIRGGVTVATATSTFPVTTTPIVQDMHYRAVSSLRQKVGNPA